MFGEFILFVRGHAAAEVNSASDRPKGVHGAEVVKLPGTAVVGQGFEIARGFGDLIRLKGIEKIKHFEGRDIKLMTIFAKAAASSALDTDSAGGRENSVKFIVEFLQGIEACLVV